jgi:hypothetical protein
MGIRQLSSASAVTGAKSNKFWNQSTYVGDFVQIASAVVTSGGTASVTFSDIPATFTHLQVRGISRSVSASTGGMWGKVYLNGDTTTANYAQHSLYGAGASAAVTAYNASSVTQYCFFTAHTGDNSWGSVVMDVLDYRSTNKNKTSRFLSGYDANGSGLVMFSSELWMNTNAVTSLTIDNTGANFAEFSSFALYGVR